MYYYAAINKFLDEIAAHWEATTEARTRYRDCPDSEDAKRHYEAVMELVNEEDQGSLSLYKLNYTDGLEALRRNNKARMVEAPDERDVNVLTVLQMIHHPGDTLLRAVCSAVGNNKMALEAVRSIAADSWSDDADHKLPACLDEYAGPMTEEQAEKHISKIERYCRTLEDLDVARVAKRYQNESEFLESVAEVKDLKGFREAVMKAPKY